MSEDSTSKSPTRLALASEAGTLPGGARWIAWAQCPACLKILRREELESHMQGHTRKRRPRPPMLLARQAPKPETPPRDADNQGHGEDDRR